MGLGTRIRNFRRRLAGRLWLAASAPPPSMKAEKMVSVLLPSRGRVKRFLKTADSLITNASKPQQIEILLRLDSNDPALKDYLDAADQVRARGVDVVILIGDRYGGYWDHYRFYNELCRTARGVFLFLFNDDALMRTRGWDALMAEYADAPCLLALTCEPLPLHYCPFPALHRRLYEVIGHFSLCWACDWWVDKVFKDSGLIKPLKVIAKHERDEVMDKTREEQLQHQKEGSRGWRSARTMALLRDDIRKVKKWLETAGAEQARLA